MNQKIEFSLKAINCLNFRSLCKEYGISTKTGYKWKERFLENGIAGMNDESRRPHTSPAGLDVALPALRIFPLISAALDQSKTQTQFRFSQTFDFQTFDSPWTSEDS